MNVSLQNYIQASVHEEQDPDLFKPYEVRFLLRSKAKLGHLKLNQSGQLKIVDGMFDVSSLVRHI